MHAQWLREACAQRFHFYFICPTLSFEGDFRFWTQVPLPSAQTLSDLTDMPWVVPGWFHPANGSPCCRASRAQLCRALDHFAVLLCRFGSTVESHSLFCFLAGFLQATLGITQICFGPHPSHLVPRVSHYEIGSPVGWSHGLDTEPSLLLLRRCFCTTYVFSIDC